MMREGDACVTLLRSKLHGLVERNRALEEENKQLRHQVSQLKGQISSLEGQDTDKRMLWKKLENYATSISYSKEKQFVQSNDGAKEALDLNSSLYHSRQQFSRRSTKEIQRVPEVVELYRSLVRREGKNDAKSGPVGIPAATNSREMIGEIENRSAYVLAIKSDVENQGNFVNFLASEVQNAAYKEIADVEEFVKWLDGELSYLVDERAVLKHFPNWPEKKADAMREAAFNYRDLKNLESEASSFHDDRRVATPMALKRMQALQDKIEQGIHNTERVRDSASGRYKDLKIPWEWMLDSGVISQLKKASLKLAKEYMNRIVNTLKSDPFANDEELLLQGVRFAFRIHQLPLERAATAVWEFSCVVPSQHESLDFKFVLKRKDDSSQYIIEEGPNRPLGCQSNEFEMRTAVFKLNEGKEVLECKVQVETEMLSPFDLATSWRAHQEYFQPSRVRGTHDVTINPGLEGGAKNGFASGLELDLEKYVVPTPNMGSSVVYAANLTENPRSLLQTGNSSNNDTTKDILHSSTKGDSSSNHYVNTMKSAIGGHAPSLEEQRVMFVDRGVGSPKFARPTKETFSMSNFKLDSESKGMPAAEGAVAAAAVADQMYGPKEDHKLAIVLVGQPARGTFTAAKLTRYLRWLGHETKHFNVGKYRRLKHGTNQTADFFCGDNREGVEARNEVAALAMEDMLSWMQEGGQVGIFDATNSTRRRRNMLMKVAEGKCKIIFLETLCNDQDVLERNIRLKVQQSPDYAEQTDFEAGVQDFKERLTYYEKVYEPVVEGSYIKMIDMVSGKGGQLKINDISGCLPGRIVFFLVNCHLTPRPILLTRHGESMDNVRGRIGGDSSLSEAGELYSRKLASFVEKRLKSEQTASIWTSTLQRTILTAHPIIGFPKIQWRALDEINAGVCDGMTYDEIKKSKPEEYESRRKYKLRYRYPRGESYLDVIQRLIPLHTIIEIQMGVAGVQEKRYKLMDAIHPTAGL
ncbi:unnamed protein product [Miscanthus lutarioriparius]|uniref:6-phosphofructo-2-kinase domain-containing protein n=1 Tax=Miscanthus lutarioriparius TaxID=422564 RepID=A0A811ME72_9POAL|nr:unnamed protein product [Miscanthus lutarioriparius]